MYPKLQINLKKLEENLNACAKITKERGGCSLMIVTKGLCADKEMVKMVAEHPQVDFIADSRVKNIAGFADLARENGKKTVLLRIPMHCEVSEVIKYVDLSFNSELSTIKLLNEEAAKAGKVHDILLMIDLGDLREGIFFQNEDLIWEAVEEILEMEHINLYGIGVNLTCYGAIIPKNENLSQLVEIAEKIEAKYGIKLEMVIPVPSIWWTKANCQQASTTCAWVNPSCWGMTPHTKPNCRVLSATDSFCRHRLLS